MVWEFANHDYDFAHMLTLHPISRIYWIQLICDAALLPVFWFILRETRGDVILAKRAKKLRKQGRTKAYAKFELEKGSVIEELKISFKRPTKMLLTEFVVISFTLWVSFAWGILFLFQSSIPLVFGELYGFNTFQSTLVELALSIGVVIATIINPVQDRLYFKSAKRNQEAPGKPIPEARLYFAVPGSLIFTAGLFWYGWGSYASLPWIVPALGIGCVGFGIYEIVSIPINRERLPLDCDIRRLTLILILLTVHGSSQLPLRRLREIHRLGPLRRVARPQHLRRLPASPRARTVQQSRLPLGIKPPGVHRACTINRPCYIAD